MDFEKLYQKIKDGTATEEETKLFKEELRKAKEISSILDESSDHESEETHTSEPRKKISDIILKSTDTESFKKALSYFNFRQAIKTIVIVSVVFVTLSVLIIGTVLGIAFYNANNTDNISREQAVGIAKNHIAEYAEIPVDKLIVEQVDKELDISFHLTKSRYFYEIELLHSGGEYTVIVNAESGYVHIDDIDVFNRFDD